MIRLIPGCGLAFALALVAAPPASAVSGETIARQLRAGKAVVLLGAHVTGELDLRETDVPAIFKCRGCTFSGGVAASDATFERTVDLSGSEFKARVDLSGATFRAPALFRVALVETGKRRDDRPATFRRDADFSFATFDDVVSFARSEFSRAGVFRDTRFADANFASAEFMQAGDFERASFRGVASFNRATSRGPASFAESDFRRGAHFVQTTFKAGAVFNNAQFAEGASFLNARFEPSKRSDEAARFQSIAAEGSLDFTFATFATGENTTSLGRARVIVIFEDVVCGESVVFRETTFGGEHRIAMVRLDVRDLVLDVDVVRQIDGTGNKRTVLEKLEESAKARGDLSDANDAHYTLLALRSDNYWAGWRALDYIFYRGIAGYFVRPFRPLLVLLAIATVLSLLRFVRRPTSASAGSRDSRVSRIGARVRTGGSEFLTYFLDTLSSVKSGRIADDTTPAVGERIEVFVYRLLLVCALIGLANSNPTLREMFDTLV